MLLIFVPKLTNRLGYTINVVMRNILQTEFAITVDPDTFRNHPEAKLCYDSHPLDNCDAIFIIYQGTQPAFRNHYRRARMPML